jgi:hypothetical protein
MVHTMFLAVYYSPGNINVLLNLKRNLYNKLYTNLGSGKRKNCCFLVFNSSILASFVGLSMGFSLRMGFEKKNF